LDKDQTDNINQMIIIADSTHTTLSVIT
jgi:hypothetical protein